MVFAIGLRLSPKMRVAYGYWKKFPNISVEFRAFADKTDEKWRMATQLELLTEGARTLRVPCYGMGPGNCGRKCRTCNDVASARRLLLTPEDLRRFGGLQCRRTGLAPFENVRENFTLITNTDGLGDTVSLDPDIGASTAVSGGE